MIAADLIERAHAVRIEDEVARRGIKLVGRIDRCALALNAAVTIASASTSENKFFSAVSAERRAMSSLSSVFLTAAASSRPSSI